LIFSEVTYLHAYVLEISLSLPSSNPKEKGFVLIICSVNHQNLEWASHWANQLVFSCG